MKPISLEGFNRFETPPADDRPQLRWLPIDQLVVDSSYQRPIDDTGRAEIARMAQEFSWSCFSPVIVASVENGKFAIIDGQRRATAAAIEGE